MRSVWRRTSTFDNNATHSEMRILGRAYRITNKQSYKAAFDRGLEFIFQSRLVDWLHLQILAGIRAAET